MDDDGPMTTARTSANASAVELGASGVWDYIVVGGGSAGAALAARLSEESHNRVLVLEAGPDWRAANAPAAIRRPERLDEVTRDRKRYGRWQWSTIMARRTLAQDARPYRQGAGLGGSSLINGMVTLRPPLTDYDEWAANGCTGWSSDDLLPALTRLEDDNEFGDEPHHGRGGPVPIWRAEPRDWSHLDRAFCTAATAMGHPWIPDQNAPEPSGVGTYPGNLLRGERVTSYDSYLEPVRGRTNLTLQGGALVDRVLFDRYQRVTRVRYRRQGEWVDAEGGEVVLCAGAIGSAAILLRSGIGPAADLRRLGIHVVADVPVGQRLQDHPMLAVTMAPPTLGGPVAGRGYEVVLRGSSLTQDNVPCDFAVHPVSAGSATSPTAALFVFLHRCDSRGTLRLRSANPVVPAVLDERMLTEPRDLARMRAAVRHTVELVRQPAFGSTEQRFGLSGAEWAQRDLADDRALDALLLAEVTDAKHVTATCPMGRPGADGVVVDPNACVVGVAGLRVADCSIVPTVPRANTYLTAVMIGERVAELIRCEVPGLAGARKSTSEEVIS